MRLIKLALFPLLAVLPASSPDSLAPADRHLLHSGIGSEHGGDLAALSEPSNLVFIGRVVRVDYRLARRSEEGLALPHTVVTYEIGQVLRGQPTARTLTMRFIGGSDGSGRFMEVSGVPQFQPGDEDLLFVSNNGENDCALVMCEWGRYRVLRGGVYNNHGFPVRAIRQTHAIARGTPPKELLTLRYPAPKFEEVIKNEEVRALLRRRNMSVAETRTRYEAEAPKQIELVRVIPTSAEKDTSSTSEAGGQYAIATTPDPLPEGPMAVEEFVSVLKRILAQTSRKPSPIRSIDPNATITVGRAIAQAPRPAEPPRVVPSPRTIQEAAELEALRKQNFNPVLKRQ